MLIPDRLRELRREVDKGGPFHSEILREALDEIERLRGLVADRYVNETNGERCPECTGLMWSPVKDARARYGDGCTEQYPMCSECGHVVALRDRGTT